MAGDAALLISKQALKRLNDPPASFKKPLFEALKKAPNNVDQLEIFRRFLFKNEGKIGKAGTLVSDSKAARKALEIVDDADWCHRTRTFTHLLKEVDCFNFERSEYEMHILDPNQVHKVTKLILREEAIGEV